MMRVHITEPLYTSHASLSPLTSELRARWARLGPTLIHSPGPFEVHGDLLTRIWHMIFRAERSPDLREEDGIYVISESDFIINPEFYEVLKTWPWEGKTAILIPYTTRDEHYNVVHHTTAGPVPPGPGRSAPPAGPDEARPDEAGGPLVGAWFMAFNFRKMKTPIRWPGLQWLGPDGPRNDAANMAYVHGKSSGFFTDGEITWLEAQDAERHGPGPFLGLSYRTPSSLIDAGTHCFFARELMNPNPDTLLLPHAPGVKPYLLKDHLEYINEYLRD